MIAALACAFTLLAPPPSGRAQTREVVGVVAPVLGVSIAADGTVSSAGTIDVDVTRTVHDGVVTVSVVPAP